MFGPGNFICGCNPDEKRRYSGDTHENGMGAADRRYDDQGFDVCPEHGERMYGWASPQTQTARGKVIDFSKMGTGKSVRINPGTVPDMRDNRDPYAVYCEIKAVSNGHN